MPREQERAAMTRDRPLICLFLFILAAPAPAGRGGPSVRALNDLVNSGFEDAFKPDVGWTYSGRDPTWTMAAPWWIGDGTVVSPGAAGSARCLQLTAQRGGTTQTASQPVGIVPGLGHRLRITGQVRTPSAGVLTVTVTDGAGHTARRIVTAGRNWAPFAFGAGAALRVTAGGDPVGPCEISLSCASGEVQVDNVRTQNAYREIIEDAFRQKVLTDAAWAFDAVLRYGTAQERGVPMEVTSFDVRTGRPISPVIGSADGVYGLLPLMYALTGETRWRDTALAHIRFMISHVTSPDTGLPGGYDPATGKLDETVGSPYLDQARLCAWAFRETGDPQFSQALRALADGMLKYGREESGRLDGLSASGKRVFPNGQDYRCYDGGPIEAMGTAYEVTGDARYADAAVGALKAFMERRQWAEWFDDPFGIPMNGMLAAYWATGRGEFLDAAREGAGYWFDRWVNTLQHASFCAGDDPRTWSIYCYLGALDGKPEYIETAKLQSLYRMKIQGFGGHWAETYDSRFRLQVSGEPVYPQMNAMNGLGTLYQFTRDPDVLLRLNAVYEDWDAFYRRPCGYMCDADERPDDQKYGNTNTARVMGCVLRTVAAIEGVPVAPQSHTSSPASPGEERALKALARATTLTGRGPYSTSEASPDGGASRQRRP
jgi:hypothetical protein